jgi:hypothetical protein
MSALVCTRCGGPVRVVRGETRYFECGTCGRTDAKAPEIPRHRTSMDPEWTDVTPAPMPRDPRTIDLFDEQPARKGPADSIPTNAEGRECRPESGDASRVLGGAP